MPLITCPECQHYPMSDAAPACPNCGHLVASQGAAQANTAESGAHRPSSAPKSLHEMIVALDAINQKQAFRIAFYDEDDGRLTLAGVSASSLNEVVTLCAGYFERLYLCDARDRLNEFCKLPERMVAIPITDEVIAELCRRSDVTRLTLSDCRKLTDESLVHLSRMSSLDELDLSGLWSWHITPRGFAFLSRLRQLNILRMPLATDLSNCLAQRLNESGSSAQKRDIFSQVDKLEEDYNATIERLRSQMPDTLIRLRDQ